MGLFALVLLGLVGLILAYGTMLYNRLVEIKHNVSKSWANIDVLLKQRHDELPKLVEVCRQYMRYEQETLEKVMLARSSVSQARQQGDVDALGSAETMLRSGLGRLFAVAEDYPELRANENFQHLATRITGLENAIADRREFYNEAVNINNVRIEQFPELIVANLCNFNPARLLEFMEEEKQDVDVKQLFAEGS